MECYTRATRPAAVSGVAPNATSPNARIILELDTPENPPGLPTFQVDIGGQWVAVSGGTNTVTGTWLNVKSFGAKGNGVNDDTGAFNRGIAACAALGGAVLFVPSGVYKITSTLLIGNGTASVASTYSGVSIIGQSCGAGPDEILGEYGPAQLSWAGPASSAVLTVNGPIGGVNISNLNINCNNIAGSIGLDFLHGVGCEISNILVFSYAGMAYRFQARAGSFWDIGASRNTFSNLSSSSPTNASGAWGAQFGQLSPGATDVADLLRCTFTNCLFTADGSTGSAVPSGVFAFTDHCTFYGCVFTYEGGSNTVGVNVQSPTNQPNFPAVISFYNCPIINGCSATGSAWGGVTGLGFFPYPTADGEPIPPQSPSGLFYGICDTMEWFGCNFNLSGTGRLIQADFGDATAANRAVFQANGTNQSTVVGAVPSGSGTTAGFRAFNAYPITNANNVSLLSEATLNAIVDGVAGTAGALPFIFQLHGLGTAAEFDISNNWITMKARADQSDTANVEANAFSVTIPNNCSSYTINPAAPLASGTVTMPATPIDRQELWIQTTATITAFTLHPNAGQVLLNAPITLNSGAGIFYFYNAALATWIRRV